MARSFGNESDCFSILALMHVGADSRSAVQRTLDYAFNLPLWTQIAVVLIPVVAVLLRDRIKARALCLMGISLFLVAVVCLRVIPWFSLDLLNSKRAWENEPGVAGIVALFVVAVAPIAFVLLVLFIIRRAKSWMNADD